MAVGDTRVSLPAGTEPPAVRAEDKRAGAAALDGLLPRVARGSENAFARVCDQVSDAVYGLVSRIVRDQSQAEQVAAEVLLEVRRSASRFSPAEGSALSWIMTMARRRAMSHAGAAGDGPRPSGTAGGGAERVAGSLLGHSGLVSLPGPQREAVLLASCGYTRRQAADLAGVPVGAVAELLREGLLGLSSHPEQPAGAPGGFRCDPVRLPGTKNGRRQMQGKEG
jgi:RNA polymerase sigma-70 factor (ECF subfamily)